MFRRAAIAVLLVAAPLGAQRPAVDSAARWVDSIFAPYNSTRSPGCAVGVTKNGSVVLAKGYGMADLEHDDPITADSRFYIASISKQFTAMAIVLLAHDGKLSLDDSVRKWVPEVPKFAAGITLRHLLYHTSGLRDYFTLLAVAGWPSDGPLTEAQFLNLVSRQKGLNFQPGDEFLYSNTGYVLLSIVVRRATGVSLRDFAAERIFKPLGMTHTEFRDDHTMLIPQRAVGYQPIGSGYRLSQPEFDVVGDGGMFSTVEDLVKWDANFETGWVGGKDGIALLESPGRLNDGQPLQYALAQTIGQFHGIKTYSHGGSYGGYRSTLLRYPEKGLSVITLCNTSTASTTLAEQVGRVYLGIAAEKANVATMDLAAGLMSFGSAQTAHDSSGARQRNDRLALLAGTYYSDELDMSVTVAAREGVLIMTRPRSTELRFIPLADDMFTNSDRMLLRVVRDDKNNVTGFALTVSRVRDLGFVKQ
ncbi:MAG TPA: serine hydrolase domain-containing protein [Gemmatimonadaceae bacterium]